MSERFQCPPDCGWCCTHLSRPVSEDERVAAMEFRAAMRDLGVYTCSDALRTGLSLSNAEAAALRAEALGRGLRVDIHPRAWLLETRRRQAVVLEWHMAHEACPFYKDFACTAYDVRPLVCRAFPVLLGAPAWALAPECPLTEPTLQKRQAGALTLGGFLRTENAARRAIERSHAALDERAMSLLDASGHRFAKGLDAREAARRLKRYRVVSLEEVAARTVPARSSTS